MRVEAIWLTDQIVQFDCQLWFSERGSEWTRPRLLRSLPQIVVSNGESHISLADRAGQIDIVDLVSGRNLGTLHTWDNEWFVFAPDGRWDSSTDEFGDVEPEPPARARVPGLLFELLKAPLDESAVPAASG